MDGIGSTLGIESIVLHGFVHLRLSARLGICSITVCTETGKCLGMVCRSTFKNVRHQLLHETSGPSSPESDSAAYREQVSLSSLHSPSISSGWVWMSELITA